MESSSLAAQAFNKGTRTSKKKKQAKLKRVLYGLKKQQRKFSSGGVSGQASFAALHLLNDPQGVVEKLFSRLRSSTETFEVCSKQLLLLPFCM